VQSKYGKGSIFTATLKQEYVSDMKILPEIKESLSNLKYVDSKRDDAIELKRVKLPNARVLIVDDNHTNLDVAKGLMKPYGMKIACVDSGQKAIDRIRSGDKKYDIIFMDQMMPGLDGIEATQKIRELGSDYAKNIPIIAFSANAVVGNEEMFIKNGFQDFLPKPIDIVRLDLILQKWIPKTDGTEECNNAELPGQTQDGQEPKKGKEGKKSESPGILSGKNVPGLDMEKGLQRYAGDHDLFLQILRTYLSDTTNLLKKIDSISNDNIKDYEIIVHGLKGSSRDIFAMKLSLLAEKLEFAAKDNDLAYLQEFNPPFLKSALKFIDDLKALIDLIDEENPKNIKDKPDNKTLSRLLAACDAFDIDEADAAIEELSAFQYKADNDLVIWLQEQVNLMKYSAIVEKLSNLTD